ncbi:MAG: DUF982 domain-containing protein [Mesorhizobium sp.]|jgi:Protein of unknown function (DUF982)|nr:DUF982 domain-containing protein [Mesorhizobium sp.]
MDTKRFAHPVSIFVGLGFPRQIETASEAFQVLNEWNGARNPTHAMALNVCRAASAGEVGVEASRLAFEAFARTRGMLAPDAATIPGKQAIDEGMAV